MGRAARHARRRVRNGAGALNAGGVAVALPPQRAGGVAGAVGRPLTIRSGETRPAARVATRRPRRILPTRGLALWLRRHRDWHGLRRCGFGQRHREETILERRGDLGRVHARREQHAAREETIAPFAAVVPLILFLFLLLLPVNREHVLLDRDVDVV